MEEDEASGLYNSIRRTRYADIYGNIEVSASDNGTDWRPYSASETPHIGIDTAQLGQDLYIETSEENPNFNNLVGSSHSISELNAYTWASSQEVNGAITLRESKPKKKVSEIIKECRKKKMSAKRILDEIDLAILNKQLD